MIGAPVNKPALRAGPEPLVGATLLILSTWSAAVQWGQGLVKRLKPLDEREPKSSLEPVGQLGLGR